MKQTERKSKLRNLSISPEALPILDAQSNKSKFVSEAIILKHKVDSESVKQFKS